ncbi:Protein CURVATURE THYLAKOID 1B chloroplastic [Bienertia sinuspersici]
MATTTTNALSFTSSSALIDSTATSRQPASVSPQCVTLPTLSPLPIQPQNRISKTTAYCRKIARNVAAMATGEAPMAAAAPPPPAAATPTSAESSPATDSLDTSEFLKTIQQAWDKVEDKYAVSSLAVAGAVAIWGSAGMAIDRLPLFPGIFEVVGIGYTGWFAYRNVIFKPDREALLQKIKNIYKEIIETS